jgi:hypothetical protein
MSFKSLFTALFLVALFGSVAACSNTPYKGTLNTEGGKSDSHQSVNGPASGGPDGN